jgi:hypothetical protein
LTQYLLYLSIVALGILVPLVVQRVLKTRSERSLVGRTLRSLNSETTANRDRLAASLGSLEELSTALGAEVDRYIRLRNHAANGTLEAETSAPAAELHVSYAMTTRTAWDTAVLAQALPLLPSADLLRYTKIYRLQQIFDDSRTFFLEAAMKTNWLDAPFDHRSLEAVDRRIECLLVLRASLHHVTDLAKSLLQAYDGTDALYLPK